MFHGGQLVHKLLFGTYFVFDHHDLGPELYVSNWRKDHFPSLVLLERLTFRLADASIASHDEVFRDIAVARGGMHPDNVAVVKSYRNEPSSSVRTPTRR